MEELNKILFGYPLTPMCGECRKEHLCYSASQLDKFVRNKRVDCNYFKLKPNLCKKYLECEFSDCISNDVCFLISSYGFRFPFHLDIFPEVEINEYVPPFI